MIVVAILALLLAGGALAVAVLAWREVKQAEERRTTLEEASADLPDDTHALRQEVAALRVENSDAFKHLSVVRYDAFREMGGHLSWTIALLDDHGSGVVLTSIHGRSDSRTYAKSVTDWTSDQQLSPEEERAVQAAHP